MEKGLNQYQALDAQERIDCLKDHHCEFYHCEFMTYLNGGIEEENMLQSEINEMKFQLQLNKEELERCNKILKK